MSKVQLGAMWEITRNLLLIMATIPHIPKKNGKKCVSRN